MTKPEQRLFGLVGWNCLRSTLSLLLEFTLWCLGEVVLLNNLLSALAGTDQVLCLCSVVASVVLHGLSCT